MNGSHFSHLEPLARRYLAIPATSTPLERVFSVAGIVVDRRRSALTPEMIDTLMFLNKNSFLLGLTDRCPTIPKPDLILEIDDDECDEVTEQGTDVDLEVLDVTEDVDHEFEETLVDESGDDESD